MGLLERADEVYEMYRDDGYMWGVPHTREIDTSRTYLYAKSITAHTDGASSSKATILKLLADLRM